MQIWGNAVIPSVSALPQPTWCRRDALIPEISAGLVLCTHSGRRSPVTKVNNGEAAGVLCYNCGGDGYGGRWVSVLLVAPAGGGRNAVILQDPGQGVSNNPVLFTYHGKDYYANTISSNPNWGGPPSYDGYTNPLSLPTIWDTQIFVPNQTAFVESAIVPIAQLLGLN